LGRHQDRLEVFVPTTFVGNHDVTRIAPPLGPDRAVLALTVLMTVAGFPSIYHGDELGLLGTKEERLGGDDAVRTALPDSPAEIVPDGVTRRLLDAHRALISLRRRHPWLTASRTEVLDLTNTRLRYRALGPDAHLVVTLDLENTTSAVVQDETGATLWRYDT
ncbi:alpha-amylase family glycosyl hydrolase, partial [Pseudactinotalea sp.]|uniref:alpha-amylase family glycosyl hydrolase n=1 Tax=Pseudactinotalea sp. TaxID=1926260 RepID=UPI003B3AFD17